MCLITICSCNVKEYLCINDDIDRVRGCGSLKKAQLIIRDECETPMSQ